MTGKALQSESLRNIPGLPNQQNTRRHQVLERLRHHENSGITSISLITPYKPIICGIADYAGCLTREGPPGRWDVLSFNLDNCEVPLSNDYTSLTTPVWYGIPSRDDFSATSISKGLRPHENQVLWFQHEFGIWRDNSRFVDMLRNLDKPNVVTLHTLHFQSCETPNGLRKEEYFFLRSLLPHTDAITVFSDGVYKAVTDAFPAYSEKVYILRHGTHFYPGYARMSKAEAKAMIHEYLVGESNLDQASKDNLRQQSVFLDPETVIIGGTGFITASKGTGHLYHAHSMLQQILPHEKIAAVYVGFSRQVGNSVDREFATELRARHNSAGQFFLETYLPGDMLAVMLRALDVYFYWPSDCTQSGIVAHALGAGATIACRAMEGVGETVKMAGGLTSVDIKQLISEIGHLIQNPEIRNQMSERALRYADEFPWRNQARRHFELAEQLCLSRVRQLANRETYVA